MQTPPVSVCRFFLKGWSVSPEESFDVLPGGVGLTVKGVGFL